MRGDVTVRAECLMPEKLLERSTALGARLSAVRRPDAQTLEVDCDRSSAKLLLGLCEKFNLRACVVRRRGMSAFARFARRRASLPAGIALCVALCALFLGRVWLIDIAFTGKNADLGQKEALAAQLGALGVRPGVSRGIDTGLLSQSLQADSGSYSYVGARIQGIRLLVEASPEAPPPPVYDVDAARDLVSDRDGIVIYAVARSGELCVAPGDAIVRGQLLIRGEEKRSKEEYRPIAALGEVIVRTWVEGRAALPLFRSQTEYTGRVRVDVRLTAPGISWALDAAEPFPEQTAATESLPVGGLFLPVDIRRQIFRETRTTQVGVDPEALKAAASALALADAAERLEAQGEYEIADRWVSFRAEEGALLARAVYEIHAEAAVTREALLQGGKTIWTTGNRSIPSA